MPELPEVETSRRGILPYLKGQKINKISVRQPHLRWIVDQGIVQCEQKMIIDIQRRAKYLMIQLPANWIVIHLGMSGSLRILPMDHPPAKHDHIDLIMGNGLMLRYTDPRRFGAWLWCQSLSELKQLQHLGPEPLSDAFNDEFVYQRCRNRKIVIKRWIMNNQFVVGVGNIYACESLFRAKIDPRRQTASLSKKECGALVTAIKGILEQAIAKGGTTLKDFTQSDGKPGYFVQQLQVYGRLNERCFLCENVIQAEKIAQRNTFYCSHCQR